MPAAIPHADVKSDARKVFDCVVAGGVAVIHLDVAYAVLAHTEAAVRRFYAAKGRSFSKPTGIVGGPPVHEALHVMGEREREMVRRITVGHDLPLAVIAPYRADHPFLRGLAPFVLQNATHDGTLNILLNAGALRSEVADLSWREGVPLVGSSANASLRGSRYRLDEVDPEVRAIADLEIDYGPSCYANPQGRSSTMIDFRDMSVVREGVCFDEIRRVLREEFRVELARRGS